MVKAILSLEESGPDRQVINRKLRGFKVPDKILFSGEHYSICHLPADSNLTQPATAHRVSEDGDLQIPNAHIRSQPP